MLIIEWYLHKAEQCELEAKETADPRTRSRYDEEQKLWREFAEREAASIRDSFRLDPDLTVRRVIH